MSSTDLSQQILDKINNSISVKFKTISSIDSKSNYNTLQYALYLTKFGRIENLSDEEYIFLLGNADFTKYHPQSTLEMIFGRPQKQSLIVTPYFLDSLDDVHQSSTVLAFSNKVNFNSVLIKSIFYGPRINTSASIWLIQKTMQSVQQLDMSVSSMRQFVSNEIKRADTRHLAGDDKDLIDTENYLDYILSTYEKESIEDCIKVPGLNKSPLIKI